MPVDPDVTPPAWFWTHDGDPACYHRDTWPGRRLIRLSSYGTGRRRRLATLTHQQSSQREARLGLDAAGLTACVGPVAITFDDDGGPTPRFSVGLACPVPGGDAEKEAWDTGRNLDRSRNAIGVAGGATGSGRSVTCWPARTETTPGRR